MPPLLGRRRRTRSNGAGKIHCGGGFCALLGGCCPRGRRRGKGGGQGPPPPGRRGRRGSGVRKSTAAEDLAPLLTGMLQRRARSKGESKPTAAGDVALLLGEVLGEKSAHPRISPSLIMILHCTFSIFGCCRGCCRICGAARVCVTHWRHATLRTQLLQKRCNHSCLEWFSVGELIAGHARISTVG